MEEEEEQSQEIPEEYFESECETLTVRYTGMFIWLVLSLSALSILVHSWPLMGTTDTPRFARSLIWASIAHHTDVYQDAQNALPPPPPSFGDGADNFPDRLLRM